MKRLKFVKSDSPYFPGDIATFSNDKVADGYVLRGTAVLLPLEGEKLTRKESDEIEPDDLPPSKGDKAAESADDAGSNVLDVDEFNAAVDEYTLNDDLDPLRGLAKDSGVGHWQVKGAERLHSDLLELLDEDAQKVALGLD